MVEIRYFRKIVLCIGLCVASSLFPNARADSASVGAPAPTFSVSDAAGSPVELGSYRGKIVVLEWFNPTCPFVKKFYSGGEMQKLQQEMTDAGVIWLTIDSSAEGKPGHLTDNEARSLMQELGMRSTKLLLDGDGKVGKMYGARTTPHVFVLDAGGKLAYAGAIDDVPSTKASDIAGATNYVRKTVQALKAGEKVEPASTEPYGCSVKY